MAKYQPVHVKIWNDPWYAKLKPPAKLLFLYLLTTPANTPSGFFYCPIEKMAFETGVPKRKCSEALESLAGHVEFDADISLVWIVQAAKYWPKSPKVLLSLENALKELGDHPFVSEFRRRHQGVVKGSPRDKEGPLLREVEGQKGRGVDEIIPVGAATPPVERFYKSTNRGDQVAALIDVAKGAGRELSGSRVGAMLKAHPKTAVMEALTTALGKNAAVLEDYMQGVLKNGPKAGRRAERRNAGAEADAETVRERW